GCPVALSYHEKWRRPAFGTPEIKANEFTHRLDVAPQADEFFCQIALNRTAVAGAHRIDKNQVCLVEPGVFVIDKLIGRRRHHAIRLHSDALWADCSHMQPDG